MEQNTGAIYYKSRGRSTRQGLYFVYRSRARSRRQVLYTGTWTGVGDMSCIAVYKSWDRSWRQEQYTGTGTKEGDRH